VQAVAEREQALFTVEAQLGLAMVRVRSVALETVVREDRAHVAVEAHREVSGGRSEQEQQDG
jgi:hypothetical protein